MRYPFEDEEKIVWMRDRSSLARIAFVREKFLFCNIRTGPIRAPKGEIIIGYAVLKKTAEKVDERGFCRRIFTLRTEEIEPDSNAPGELLMPEEVVDPHSVKAGKPTKEGLNA